MKIMNNLEQFVESKIGRRLNHRELISISFDTEEIFLVTFYKNENLDITETYFRAMGYGDIIPNKDIRLVWKFSDYKKYCERNHNE